MLDSAHKVGRFHNKDKRQESPDARRPGSNAVATMARRNLQGMGGGGWKMENGIPAAQLNISWQHLQL